MNKEIWNRVYWNTNYEISSYGKLKHILSGRIHLGYLNRDGYLYVNLISKSAKIHILVLEAFDSKRPYKLVCNHKDGNKLNNHINNLEWVTSSKNTKHAWDNGLMVSKTKLTVRQVKYIRYVIKNKLKKQIELAKIFKVKPATIGDIVHYRSWKNI